MTTGELVETRGLSGVAKVALVLMNMSTERASAVLRTFSPEEAERIAGEMARIRRVDGQDAETAIAEFRLAAQEAATAQPERTGMAVATELLEATYEPAVATEMIERIAAPGSTASFTFADSLEPAKLVTLLEDETAATVAFVLVQLGPDLAAKVLMGHDADRRIDIAQAVATMGSPAPESGAIIADVLRRRAQVAASAIELPEEDEAGPGAAPVLRVQPLVDIMNHAEPAAEGELLAGLRERDGILADEVRAKLLSFEDVPRIQDRDLQQILRGLDIGQLALALKGASDEIAGAIKANMSERNRESLAEESAELGRVKKSQVEEARNAVVRAIRELAGTQGLELKKTDPDPGSEETAAADTPAEDAEPEEEYVD